MPKISIVTPSYNHAKYIVWTVRSVLLQRYPDLEYVLMDGGSKDGTMDVLEPYLDRFAHWQSAKDAGQADAIHNGFKHCTGEIMAYLNSDDMLAPGALQFVARYFEEHPDVDVIYSHRCTVDEQNKVCWYWELPKHSDYLMMRWDLIPQETCFWRRRVFEKAGNVDPTFRFALDYDLFVRFMLAGRFARVNRFLGAFRQHADAKTTQLLATVGMQEIQRVWRTYGLTAGRFGEIRSKRFTHGVHRAGSRYAQRTDSLPGALPGVGWNYDELWGGMLNDTRVPPSPEKDAEAGELAGSAAE